MFTGSVRIKTNNKRVLLKIHVDTKQTGKITALRYGKQDKNVSITSLPKHKALRDVKT